MASLKIIFEDEYLLILDKPPNLVVTPDQIHQGDTIADILKKDFGITLDRGGVVHRLDKDTSGLLIAAKTQESFEILKSQFEKRIVKKEYLALVHGVISKPGQIAAPIARNPLNRLKFDIFEEGRESSTGYQPEKNLKMSEENIKSIFQSLTKHELKKLLTFNFSSRRDKLCLLFTLLRCFPQTGRTHQIRVHLKYINHPIVSDSKYGGRKNSKYDLFWCPRQFLHAQKIEFTHPARSEIMIFESPLPDDLNKALGYLEPLKNG